ncbi:hypothetical protein [Streptomyces sp. NPDC102360]|uniref:hypothetical protein n=1 Tax=Streptomyces sp. NPDC102360 TaxID=3366160 RepID=UPI00381845E1
MRHRPLFRWVLTLGVVLFGWAAYLYASYPATRQIDLTVISEKPDGRCTVRWKDPYQDGDRRRESAYRCDPGRGDLLKPSHSILGAENGWETGFMFTEGRHRGDLEPSLDDSEPYALSDALVLAGLALIAVGLVGGNTRAATALTRARPRTVARARTLHEAARRVAHDHAQACEAARAAWHALRTARIDAELGALPARRLAAEGADRRAVRLAEAAGAGTAREVLDAGVPGLRLMGVGHEEAARLHTAARRRADAARAAVPARIDPDTTEPRTTALLVALHVLVDAGPDARRTARTAQQLAGELEGTLADAQAASGYRSMLRAGREQRDSARDAVDRLRSVMARAEREGLPARFAQTSVDLLRAPDDQGLGLSARADFENRPGRYYALLAQLMKEKAAPAEL